MRKALFQVYRNSRALYQARCLIRDLNAANQLLHPDETITENVQDCFRYIYGTKRMRGFRVLFYSKMTFEPTLSINKTFYERLSSALQAQFELRKDGRQHRVFSIDTHDVNPDFETVVALLDELVNTIEQDCKAQGKPSGLLYARFKSALDQAIDGERENSCSLWKGLSKKERLWLKELREKPTFQFSCQHDKKEASGLIKTLQKKKWSNAAIALLLAVLAVGITALTLAACITGIFPILTVISIIASIPALITLGIAFNKYQERAGICRRLSNHASAFFSSYSSKRSIEQNEALPTLPSTL